jgi:hypothetical protein
MSVCPLLLGVRSPHDTKPAAAVSAHARAHDLNNLARAQEPVLQPAVGLATQLARVADQAPQPVRRRPVRQCLGPRHRPRALLMSVCRLPLGVKSPPDSGAPVSAHARAYDLNHLVRAQDTVLQPAVRLAAQLARIDDRAQLPVRRGLSASARITVHALSRRLSVLCCLG